MPEPPPEPLTPTLLRTAYNAVSGQIYRSVTEAGAADMRPAHGNAMEALAIEDGLRLTDMAARAGMAPQSMGELVDDLVARGYVERRDDPDDRRAKRIYLTQKGRAIADASRIAVIGVEQRLIELVGRPRYRQLRRQLTAIIEGFSSGDG